MEKSIAIGIPTVGYLHWRFAADLMSLQLPMSTRVVWQVRTMIDTARNLIVTKALEDVSTEYILMIDDDMTFDPDFLMKLIAHDVDIVAGLAFKRTPDYHPCVYKRKPETDEYVPILPNVFQEVDIVGTGGILIKRKVFEALKYPYFETWFDKKNVDKHYSVDFDFCMKAKKAGFKIFVDPEAAMGHIGEAPIITKENFLEKMKTLTNLIQKNNG
jgi:glycosyltransferase involved in cell wall biosynthesis